MRTDEPLRVVIAGGGTGGHLYPGIAVARALIAREPDATVTFAGTAAGVEAKIVPRAGFELDTIRSAGLKRKSVPELLRGLAMLPASALDAWRVLSRRAPHLAIGLGGYSSGPVLMLAALRGIPTLVMEQNVVPGVANRILAHVVGAAAVTYETSLSFFGRKGFVSGNPVRPEFRTGADERRSDEPAHVLVFGGSQGAHAINVAMMEAAPELARLPGSLSITHQTGEHDLSAVRDAYHRAGLAVRVEPFLFEMDREMTQADLVICRAGATTIAELAMSARPAILVPLPTAADDHQRKNAEELQRAGAARVVEQRHLTGDRIAREIAALVADPDRRRQMSEAIRRFARSDAADVIVVRALELAAPARRRAAA